LAGTSGNVGIGDEAFTSADLDYDEEEGGRSPGPGGWIPTGGPGWERLTETRPFLLTTEFFATLAALAALAVTAASSDSFDARLVWPLATAIVAAYVLSRGLGKAAAPSRSWDPRESPERWWSSGGSGESMRARGKRAGAGEAEAMASAARYEQEEETQQMTTTRDEYVTQRQMGGSPYGYSRMRQAFPIETKPFFLTSEFWGSVALIVGLAIAAGTSEQIDARLFWILGTAITIGYVLSRGIAKSGTKSRSWDPREELMQRAGERVSRGS
jgi:hypothetical protein